MDVKHTGVIVGRFQAPALTAGHQHLLTQVGSRCARVIVMIGCPPNFGTKRDPMEYSLRARMVQDYWSATFGQTPELTVLPCLNSESDTEWASRIDMMARAVSVASPLVLYCGHDGCGPVYTASGGTMPVSTIAPIGGHATDARAAIQPVHSEDFRAGLIYGIQRQFTAVYPVVDAVVYRRSPSIGAISVLMAQKATDTPDTWRVIGGFVDPSDQSLEQAVRREVREETGVEVGDVQYCCSMVIDDWRYRGCPEGILSAVFVAQYVFGAEKASDDIARVSWMSTTAARASVHPNHARLLSVALSCIPEIPGEHP